MNNIRNFSIIAHIDHGKSTLADRILESTGTIEKRKMRDQILDVMELERERGITIKMQPVTIKYTHKGEEYALNLIDTPGHIDFAYEVSRSLYAVEGAVLLIDSTQGIEAQTLSVLDIARDAGLTIIPVLSKTDSPLARCDEISEEIVKVLDCKKEDIIQTSGKTGEGIEELLASIIENIKPPQKSETNNPQALIFDYAFSSHNGIIAYIRVFSGSINKGDALIFAKSNHKFDAKEVGILNPEELKKDALNAGDIGYIKTGIKKAGIARVGDTIMSAINKTETLPGYKTPAPVVWASLFPQEGGAFPQLKKALEELQLTDSSLSFEEESSIILGKGFRCGLLGMLHLEIITERIRREFNIELVITTPSVDYRVVKKDGTEDIYTSPAKFPEYGLVDKVYEPWVEIEIISPNDYMSKLVQLFAEHEVNLKTTEPIGITRLKLIAEMPLRELARNFFDKLESVSSGFVSLSYKRIGERQGNVTRLDILIAEELFPAFSQIVSKEQVEREARKSVEIIAKHLPRQLFSLKIQGKSGGTILASRSLTAIRKDVTAKLYGGDITRKMKLREKQKKGKARMRATGSVNVSHDVFLKVMRDKQSN